MHRIKIMFKTVYVRYERFSVVSSGFCMQSRGCPLKGLPSTPTLEAHRQRFLNNGWEKAEAVDLDTIYKYHLDAQDKRRYTEVVAHNTSIINVLSASMCIVRSNVKAVLFSRQQS